MFRILFLLLSWMSIEASANSISLQYNSTYFNFEGTQAARDNIYAFRNVTLHRQNLGASYTVDSKWRINLNTSISENYAETYFGGVLFEDKTSGLNDTLLSGQYIQSWGTWLLIPEVGVFLPTGSVNEKNKNNPQFNYPYNMQLGSGTYDLPVALTLTRPGLWTSYARAQWVKRLGRNSEDYRLGDEYMGVAGVEYAKYKWLTPGLRGLYRHREGIAGQDKTYGRNIYVEYYHHDQINWDLSAVLKSSVTLPTATALNLGLEIGIPLVQGLQNYDDVIVETQYYAQLGLLGYF